MAVFLKPKKNKIKSKTRKSKQAVKNEEESKVETKEEAVDINKGFTERTGILIPKSYK